MPCVFKFFSFLLSRVYLPTTWFCTHSSFGRPAIVLIGGANCRKVERLRSVIFRLRHWPVSHLKRNVSSRPILVRVTPVHTVRCEHGSFFQTFFFPAKTPNTVVWPRRTFRSRYGTRAKPDFVVRSKGRIKYGAQKTRRVQRRKRRELPRRTVVFNISRHFLPSLSARSQHRVALPSKYQTIYTVDFERKRLAIFILSKQKKDTARINIINIHFI